MMDALFQVDYKDKRQTHVVIVAVSDGFEGAKKLEGFYNRTFKHCTVHLLGVFQVVQRATNWREAAELML